jgi:hypothetical protein
MVNIHFLKFSLTLQFLILIVNSQIQIISPDKDKSNTGK